MQRYYYKALKYDILNEWINVLKLSNVSIHYEHYHMETILMVHEMLSI